MAEIISGSAVENSTRRVICGGESALALLRFFFGVTVLSDSSEDDVQYRLLLDRFRLIFSTLKASAILEKFVFIFI